MFLDTQMAQNWSGGLIRPTLQSEEKLFGGQKKSGISYLPYIKYFMNIIIF